MFQTIQRAIAFVRLRETSLRLTAVPRLAYTCTYCSSTRVAMWALGRKAWLGLGGGAVYELLVGLREEDKAKS